MKILSLFACLCMKTLTFFAPSTVFCSESPFNNAIIKVDGEAFFIRLWKSHFPHHLAQIEKHKTLQFILHLQFTVSEKIVIARE